MVSPVEDRSGEFPWRQAGNPLDAAFLSPALDYPEKVSRTARINKVFTVR
jgi:hypothetical protein